MDLAIDFAPASLVINKHAYDAGGRVPEASSGLCSMQAVSSD